jgi:hypothetical protein
MARAIKKANKKKASAKKSRTQLRVAAVRTQKVRAKPRSGVGERAVKASRVLAGSPTAKAAERDYLLRRRVEDIAQAYVSLLGELWIIKDRQAVLEELLGKRGMITADEVERYEPEGEFKNRLDAERREWIARAVGALFRKGLPKVN